MSERIDSFYQRIGGSAIAEAEGLAGRLLLYAEVEDGAISADMFYVEEAGGVRFRFCSEELRDLVYSFWQAWQLEPGFQEWRTLAYVIDGGKFSVDLKYPEEIDEDEGTHERRPAIVEAYFGGMEVDYSRP